MSNLRGRSLLNLMDFTPEEIHLMLDVAADYKRKKKAGELTLHEHEGKSIALLFEKTSTRTRSAFEVAASDLGINAVYLGKDDIQLGKKESLEDTAIVLGRMFDGIEFRGFAQQTVEDLAKFSGVPVWNGLTNLVHPTQALADFMTIKEHLGELAGMKLVFMGDGADNVSNSLMIASAKMGLHYVIATPDSLQPPADLLEAARQVANETGGSIEITNDPTAAVKDANVIYTDVWVSMGEEDLIAQRIELLKPYQVNMDLINATGNPNVIFMHCLPAFHDTNTTFAQEVQEKYGLTEMEVTDEVFRSKHNVAFDEAENRMHTIKSVIALTI